MIENLYFLQFYFMYGPAKKNIVTMQQGEPY